MTAKRAPRQGPRGATRHRGRRGRDTSSCPAISIRAAAVRSADATAGGEGPYITPLVRKLAIEHGVDLGSVEGSGVGGRIRKQDVVEAARAMRPPQAATPAGPAGAWLTRASRRRSPARRRQSATAPPAAGPVGTAPAAPAARRARAAARHGTGRAARPP